MKHIQVKLVLITVEIPNTFGSDPEYNSGSLATRKDN
jgi:hypothetical protein